MSTIHCWYLFSYGNFIRYIGNQKALTNKRLDAKKNVREWERENCNLNCNTD